MLIEALSNEVYVQFVHEFESNEEQCKIWWVWEDLNFRPHPYQGCALTN